MDPAPRAGAPTGGDTTIAVVPQQKRYTRTMPQGREVTVNVFAEAPIAHSLVADRAGRAA